MTSGIIGKRYIFKIRLANNMEEYLSFPSNATLDEAKHRSLEIAKFRGASGITQMELLPDLGASFKMTEIK